MLNDPRFTPSSVSRSASIDAGLRTHFQSIYNTMSLGLLVTGLVAFGIAHSPDLIQLIFGTPLKYVAIFAPMAFVLFGFSPRAVATKSAAQLKTLFYVFSAVFGVSMSVIFLAYAGEDIARVFFITAGMFAATSLFGYTTKRDLTGLGGLMIMGALGLFIAMIVNMFLQSSMLQFVISGAGVLIYTGLVAWDTQNIKESYNVSYGNDANAKGAVMGALSLYMNFIMLFQFLLQLFGGRR